MSNIWQAWKVPLFFIQNKHIKTLQTNYRNMSRILHDTNNAKKILELTTDTLLLIDPNGICIDIDNHSNFWFLQEENLLGKNIFDLLPPYTREKISSSFYATLQKGQRIEKNFKLELKDNTYYFKCIMYPYEGNVLCQYRDITQRSNIKRLLEQANFTLREIQKVAQIGQWTYSFKDKVFYYWGYSDILCSEEVQKISFSEYLKIIVEEDRPNFIRWCLKSREMFNQESISYRIRVKGEILYIRIRIYLRKQLSDGSINLEGYIQNITDIQRRRNNINTLTHAINKVKESIYAAKEDGTIIFANHLFMQDHNISENEDISRLKIYELIPEHYTKDKWKECCLKALQEGEFRSYIHHPLKGNKDILAFESVIYYITSDSGEASYWSFTHDISERIRYEAQIKRFNRIINTTINHIPAAIVVKEINNNFRYIYRNRESFNRESYQQTFDGKNDFDYYPANIAKQKRKEDIQVAATGKELHWIEEEKDKKGNQLILDKRKIRVDGDELSSPIIISIEWDITELEKVKRELQLAKEKAEASDKLKSAFLANMSHEIRTPLNAIVGFSQLIAESVDSKERQAYYNVVKSNNARLLELINEILDLSKIESGILEFACEPVNLDTLCKEVYDTHFFRAPKGVEFVYEQPDCSVVINTDKNRIFQVLSNLINNAFKFTSKGSIRYGYRLKDDEIVFHVSDTGIGIDPTKIHQVFERFAKLNNSAQGTGLGLSICKTIVDRLGGFISVTSETNKGSTFTFTLPYKNDDKSQENIQTIKDELLTDVSASEENDSKQHTILIAEDTDSNYNLLDAFLSSSYKLLRARNGIEAVTMYEKFKPDLILMDIEMPDLNGLEATKIIRELSPTLPIIIQSAHAYEEDRHAALKAGCNNFIAKPFSQEKLKEMIREQLA